MFFFNFDEIYNSGVFFYFLELYARPVHNVLACFLNSYINSFYVLSLIKQNNEINYFHTSGNSLLINLKNTEFLDLFSSYISPHARIVETFM